MIKALINSLNKNISEIGVVMAMKKFMKRCNTKIVVKSNEKIDKVLEKFSGVIVANHPAEADVLAILSAIKNRKDVFLIINSQLMELIPELDNHLIPVYISNKITENWMGRIKLWFLAKAKKLDNYSKEEEHQKNIASISMAIEKINKGGLVIIFPSGGDEKHGWLNGIGHLIHGIENKEKSFVIRAHIEGTSNWDYLRLLPLVGKFLPKFKISFANPLRIDKIKMDCPKKTTTELENNYWNWIFSVKMWTKLTKNYAWIRMLFLFFITKP